MYNNSDELVFKLNAVESTCAVEFYTVVDTSRSPVHNTPCPLHWVRDTALAWPGLSRGCRHRSTQQPHGDKEPQLTNYNESNYRIFYLCFSGFELFYCILVHLFHHNFPLVFVTGSIFSLLFFLEFILIFLYIFFQKKDIAYHCLDDKDSVHIFSSDSSRSQICW